MYKRFNDSLLLPSIVKKISLVDGMAENGSQPIPIPPGQRGIFNLFDWA